MQENVFIGILNILCGLLFIAISIPLLKQKIKMNGWYGIRIPKAFESDENWFRINGYGAKQLITWSVPVIAIGFLCFFLPLDSPLETVGFSVGPITACTAISVIQILRYAKKL